MISVNLAQEIISLPQAGIWALVNEKDRRIYLTFSNAVAGSLTRNLMALKDGSHRSKQMVKDLPKLTFKLIEPFSKSNVENRLRLKYWMDQYSVQEYEHYISGVSIKIRVQKELSAHPRGVIVRLVNSRYKKIPLGLFGTMEEADRFIETNYRNGIYHIIKDHGLLSQQMFKRLEDED